MAIALPLLLLILLGTIDLGRAFFDYIQLRNGTIEGATYGSRHPSEIANIKLAVTNSGVPASTTSTVNTTGDCTTIKGTGMLTVKATSEFEPVSASFLARFGIDTWTLSASASMRCLT